jgi:uncharacterized surface protein with fasciclin (FAS1) repeats
MYNRIPLVLMMLLATSMAFVSCSKDDDDDDNNNTTPNIVELAQTDTSLTSLVAAVVKAGLADELSADGNLTVFAPTNAAFSAFLSANGFATLDDVPNALLTQVLLNHVVGQELPSTALTTGYLSTLATYGTTTSNLKLYVSTVGGVTLNGNSAVTAANLEASNGVVHKVNTVIGLPILPTFALADPNFSTLVAAITRPGLTTDYVTALSGAGPLTVFAPTNDAFAALLTELGASSLDSIPTSTLEAVLNYHVVSGNVLAGSLTEGQIVTPLGSGTFTIGLTGGPKITDGSNRVTNIIATDVQANNGVIHAIDRVLVPAP